MKKPIMAVLIAFVVTACVGASIFAIGGAALGQQERGTSFQFAGPGFGCIGRNHISTIRPG